MRLGEHDVVGSICAYVRISRARDWINSELRVIAGWVSSMREEFHTRQARMELLFYFVCP